MPRDVVATDPTIDSSDSDAHASTVAPGTPRERPRSLPPAGLEGYELGAEVARGGMGRIVAARDRRLGREVALKQLLRAGEDIQQRFEREALITARLQHPAIVPIYEAGRLGDGEPFYTMRLVAGRSLDRVIASSKTLDERLKLLPNLIAVVDALAYAHAQRVIHRDLKPANVLVGEFGETVVIDWGLAKDLDDAEVAPDVGPYRGTSDGTATAHGTILGTPAYMAPEQARGEVVDERADVYALGAMLYQLIAGHTPYPGKTAEDVLAGVLSKPPPPLAEVAPGAPRDLTTIVERAMAREPADRYASSGELAADLRRFHTGQLVGAHVYSWRERATRFARRHKRELAIAGVAGVALATLGTLAFLRVVDERDRADAERAAAQTERAVAVERAENLIVAEARASLAVDPTRTLALLAELSGERHTRAARMLAFAALEQGAARTLRGHTSAIATLAWSPDGKLLASGAVSGDDSLRVWNVSTGESQIVRGHSGVRVVRFAANGRFLASAGADGLRIWPVEAAGKLGAARAIAVAPANAMEVSNDGSRIGVVDDTGALWLVDVATGTARIVQRELPAEGKLAFSDSGRHVVLLGGGGAFDTQTGAAVAHCRDVLADRRSAYGTVGEAVVGVTRENQTFTCDLLTGQQGEPPFDKRDPTGARYWTRNAGFGVVAPAQLVFATWGTEASTISLSSPARRERWLVGHTGARTMELSPDGAMLASAGDDREIRIWTVATPGYAALKPARDGRLVFADHGRVLAAFRMTSSAMNHPSFDADDLVTGKSVYDNAWGNPEHVLALPDGKHLLTTSSRADVIELEPGQHGALVWPLGDSGKHRGLDGQRGPVAAAAVAPTGAIAIADPHGAIRIWASHASTGRALGTHALDAPSEGYAPNLPVPSDLLLLAFSDDGRSLVSASQTGRIVIWDVAAGTSRVLAGGTTHPCATSATCQPPPRIRALMFARDGSWLATAGDDAAITLYPLSSGAPRVLAGHVSAIRALALSPDGARLFSAAADGTVRVWSPSTGEGRILDKRADGARAIALSPDGELLAVLRESATYRHTLDLVDVETGEAFTVGSYQQREPAFAFGRDGAFFYAVPGGPTVKLSSTVPRDGRALRAFLQPYAHSRLAAETRPR